MNAPAPSLPKISTEGELCDFFADAAHAAGLAVYPEVDGWDLVLVDGDTQVGVEAKMRAGIEVLDQAVGRFYARHRPNFAVILVPDATIEFHRIANGFGIGVVQLADLVPRVRRGQTLQPLPLRELVVRDHDASFAAFIPVRHRYDMDERRPLELPPVAMVHGGGRPSPRVLSKWRVKALRLWLKLESLGSITGADFKTFDIDRRVFIERRWIIEDGKSADGTKLYRKHPEADFGPSLGYRDHLDALRSTP